VEKGKILAIEESCFFNCFTGDTVLQIYDDEFFAFDSFHAFPPVTVDGTDYASHGRYVFFEDEGNKTWTIVEADSASGLALLFGVVSFTLETEIQPLAADVDSLSISAGGAQTLSLDAGTDNGGLTYLVLGSTNGTLPGIPFGEVVLPLNFELDYFWFTATHPNQGPLVDTLGVLDGNGQGQAQIQIMPGMLSPSLAGTVAHHAYLVFEGSNAVFASNATSLTLLP